MDQSKENTFNKSANKVKLRIKQSTQQLEKALLPAMLKLLMYVCVNTSAWPISGDWKCESCLKILHRNITKNSWEVALIGIRKHELSHSRVHMICLLCGKEQLKTPPWSHKRHFLPGSAKWPDLFSIPVK